MEGSWGVLGPSWGRLGPVLGLSWGHLGGLRGVLRGPGTVLSALVGSSEKCEKKRHAIIECMHDHFNDLFECQPIIMEFKKCTEDFDKEFREKNKRYFITTKL